MVPALNCDHSSDAGTGGIEITEFENYKFKTSGINDLLLGGDGPNKMLSIEPTQGALDFAGIRNLFAKGRRNRSQ